MMLFSSLLIGSGNLDQPDVVEEVNGSARQSLQDHVMQTRPTEKMRYSSILLCLHALCAVNSITMETLFCQHLAKTANIEALLRNLLESPDP